MMDEPSKPCSEDHVEGASEWHEDGKLCIKWLRNLERGRFSEKRCRLIRLAVVQDELDHFNRIDAGELIRLDGSLSRTLPQRRGFLRMVSASLGPVRGRASFEDEYRDFGLRK